MNNCPNCGAPIVAAQCEYCGTVFPEYVSKKMSPITQYLQKDNVVRKRKRTLEQQRLELDNALIEAKTKALANAEEIKVLYEDAIQAMRAYSH